MTSKNHYKGVKTGFVFIIISLLIIFISAGIFFFSQRTSNVHRGSATPTRGKITPTPTPTLTVQSTPEPLFFDDFTQANKGWSLDSVSGYTRIIEDNRLTLADANHTILTESLPTSATFDNFMLAVTFTLLQADQDDSVGLYIRGDSNLDHDYRVDIYGNNTYAISKEFLDTNKSPQVQFLVNSTKAASLKPVGQENMVTVMMKGPQLVLLINGKVVNSVIDSDYTSGQIALFVQDSMTSSGVEAAFSSVAVYPAPDQLPTG
jgi:hypothetical protein